MELWFLLVIHSGALDQNVRWHAQIAMTDIYGGMHR